MSEWYIGQWITREDTRTLRRLTRKAHLVQSKINDAYYTRCGRRMAPNPDRHSCIEFSETAPDASLLCARCQ